MAPANKAWRPILAKDINDRRDAMTKITNRLVRFYVAGAENERKMLMEVAEYCLVTNINKTAYERGIDHPLTGPLATILQAPKSSLTAVFAYAVQQAPTKAKSQAKNNPLMNAVAERVSKLIGANGEDCYIPEDCAVDEAEAHAIIARVMAMDPHFRYYDREFVIRVEAAAKFPNPEPFSFLPVTSEMRYNMPILCPGDVVSEINLILEYKDAWKGADTDVGEPLVDILNSAAVLITDDSWRLGSIYEYIIPKDKDEKEAARFAVLVIMFAYAELKIFDYHYTQYQGIYLRVFHARTLAHKGQLGKGFRPIVFGQQNVDAQNARLTFRHHAWREPPTKGSHWKPSTHQLPYADPAIVNDAPWVIDIITPSSHWKRQQFPDNRNKNKTRVPNIIGFRSDDVDKEPEITSQAIINQLELQQPDPILRRWGVNVTQGIAVKPLVQLRFARSGTRYPVTALPANDEDLTEVYANIEKLYTAQVHRAIIPRKGKQAVSGLDSATSTPAPGDVDEVNKENEVKTGDEVNKEKEVDTENETKTPPNTGSTTTAAPGIQPLPPKPKSKKRKAAADTGSGVLAPTAAKRKAIDAEIQQKNAVLAHHTKKFMELDQKIEALETQVELRKLVINERDTEIADLKASVDAKKLEVEGIHKQLGASGVENQLLQTQVKNLKREVEKQKSETQKLEVANEQLRREREISRELEKLQTLTSQAEHGNRMVLEIQKLREEKERAERERDEAQGQKSVFRRMREMIFGE